MQTALVQAQTAGLRGEIPVGAVVVCEGRILAAAGNEVRAHCDPTAHAEIVVLRHVCKIRHMTHLEDCDLYVTLEPCVLCAAAISFVRLRRLYFGCYDPKGGAVDHGPRWFQQSTCHHRPEVIGGIEETRSATLLRLFFEPRRPKNIKTLFD